MSEGFNRRTEARSSLVAKQSHTFLCYLGFWQPVLREVNDAQNIICIGTKNIYQCAKKTRALHTVLEAKREEFVDDALIYAKSLCEELDISFEIPRRIRRKRVFGDGNKDVRLSTASRISCAAVAEWYRYRTVACLVTSSSPVPLKTRRVGQRCTLNLSRVEMSSRWCGSWRRGASSPWFKITWSSTSLDHGSKLRGPSPKTPRVAEQCDR
ncbi:uncharacterized protein TNCV_4067911 [Trichonephila clavipes]|nr:uncharacterized protein TNCV_4067911 [Trichonephila clavipes]